MQRKYGVSDKKVRILAHARSVRPTTVGTFTNMRSLDMLFTKNDGQSPKLGTTHLSNASGN